MSVTFTTTESAVIGFVAECGHGQGVPFDSYEDASMWLEMFNAAPYNLDGCTDDLCLEYPPSISPVHEGGTSPKVNMANGNVVEIFKVLGLLSDAPDNADVDDAFQGGSLSAEDFMGRIVIAEAMAPISPARPTVESQSSQGARFIECGLPEGYMQGRIADLRVVAEYAIANNRDIQWG